MLKYLFVLFFIFIQINDCHAKALLKKYHENTNEPWGTDQDLSKKSSSKQVEAKSSVCSTACQSMIRFFQIYISPIDGPRSSFIPTSSQYALLSIRKYGVLKGIAMGCDRLMRENSDPWCYRTIVFEDNYRKTDLPR